MIVLVNCEGLFQTTQKTASADTNLMLVGKWQLTCVACYLIKTVRVTLLVLVLVQNRLFPCQ